MQDALAEIETHPYDRIAVTYDFLFTDDASRAEDRAVIAAVNYSGGSVLDIGCGTGLFLDYVQPDSYLGIDPSSVMLNRFRAKHGDQELLNCGMEYLAADGADFESFDLIIGLYGSPSYVSPWALSRVPQLLAPGGRYFLMFYRDTYEPITHRRTGVAPLIYRANPYLLAGRVSQIGNFIVVEGNANG